MANRWGNNESSDRLYFGGLQNYCRMGPEASLVAQRLKRLPAMWETWVRSLGWEDPLEKEPTPVFLPGKSHGQRSLVGYSPWGHKQSDTPEQLHFHFLSWLTHVEV